MIAARPELTAMLRCPPFNPATAFSKAIVVGVSTMSVALALCIRIREEWGTLESDELSERDSP